MYFAKFKGNKEVLLFQKCFFKAYNSVIFFKFIIRVLQTVSKNNRNNSGSLGNNEMTLNFLKFYDYIKAVFIEFLLSRSCYYNFHGQTNGGCITSFD